MTEITSAAYEDLRNYMKSEWKYIELQNDKNVKIVRLASTDPRVTISVAAETVKFQVVMKGTDADLQLPITFAKSKIFKDATTNTSLCEESFTQFAMESESDELTVVHTIQVPKVI